MQVYGSWQGEGGREREEEWTGDTTETVHFKYNRGACGSLLATTIVAGLCGRVRASSENDDAGRRNTRGGMDVRNATPGMARRMLNSACLADRIRNRDVGGDSAL